jgi:hypothetical protein
MKLFRALLSIAKAPYLLLKKRCGKKADKERRQFNRRCRTDTISALMRTCEFAARTIAELRAENREMRETLRFQAEMIDEFADKLVEAGKVKKADDRQKVVLGMELRETESKLAIANEKIEGVRTMLEILRE